MKLKFQGQINMGIHWHTAIPLMNIYNFKQIVKILSIETQKGALPKPATCLVVLYKQVHTLTSLSDYWLNQNAVLEFQHWKEVTLIEGHDAYFMIQGLFGVKYCF